MDQNWKVLSKQRIFENGKFCTAETHTLQLPDGRIIDKWTWLIMPDFVNVVVIDTQDRYVMFRQSKYAVEGISLAPVGGFIEPGEAPLAAAKRETLEELGYQARRWFDLGCYRVDSNRGCGMGYAYLALDAEKVSEPDADDLERQEIIFLSRKEVEDALFNGEIKVLSWANNVALALKYMDRTDLS